MSLTVSIVIPVYNASPYLADCLNAVRNLDPAPAECIIVDDGSTDGSAEIAEGAGIRVISCDGRCGPGVARNLGARAASGDILLFVDADVRVPADAVARILARFDEAPERDAVIGSYDDRPGSANFLSQYRNLLHCYTHQNSNARTCTFWTGCGAIRARVFREHGGFSEAHALPYLEDIELGLRLRQAGRTIWLDKGLCVKHLKRLGFVDVVKTDLLYRAVPWTALILRYRSMPADLNLRWGQRASVVLAPAVLMAVLGALLAVGLGAPGAGIELAGAAALAAAVLALLNRSFYRFLAQRRGWGFVLRVFPLHCVYFLCCGLGFAMGMLGYALGVKAPVEQRVSSKCDG